MHTGVSGYEGGGRETGLLHTPMGQELSPLSARVWVFCLMRQNVKQVRDVEDSDKKRSFLKAPEEYKQLKVLLLESLPRMPIKCQLPRQLGWESDSQRCFVNIPIFWEPQTLLFYNS